MPGPEGLGVSGAENFKIIRTPAQPKEREASASTIPKLPPRASRSISERLSARGTHYQPNSDLGIRNTTILNGSRDLTSQSEKEASASTLPKLPPRNSRRIPERLSVGSTYYHPNGDEITVTARHPLPRRTRRNISQTTWLESGHALIGKKNGNQVHEVSIVPTKYSRGHTLLSAWDPESAAFHPFDEGGGHDLHLLLAHGDDPHMYASRANESKITYREEILDIAEELEDKKTLNDTGVEDALSKGKKERKEHEKSYFMADIYIRQRDGKIHKKEKVFAPEGIIFYPENGIVPEGTTIH